MAGSFPSMFNDNRYKLLFLSQTICKLSVLLCGFINTPLWLTAKLDPVTRFTDRG